MTYAADNALDFASIARELGAAQGWTVAKQGKELVPAEANSRMQREGGAFLRRPALNGATVDQEGLTNNYAVEPIMYFSDFPSAAQQRLYALQGAAAALFVTGLLLTAVSVS
jgi:hypothetical protein